MYFCIKIIFRPHPKHSSGGNWWIEVTDWFLFDNSINKKE